MVVGWAITGMDSERDNGSGYNLFAFGKLEGNAEYEGIVSEPGDVELSHGAWTSFGSGSSARDVILV